MDGLVKSLEKAFANLPKLPPSAVGTLYGLAPWLAIIFGILSISTALSAFGVISYWGPFAGAVGVSTWTVQVSALGLGVSGLLMIAAFPGLKAGKIGGWNMLFCSEIVSILASLVSVNIGTIVGALIGLYILFQIKPKYK